MTKRKRANEQTMNLQKTRDQATASDYPCGILDLWLLITPVAS
jgi:hypothetical protein